MNRLGLGKYPVEVQDFKRKRKKKKEKKKRKKTPSYWRNLWNVPQISKENLKDHHMSPVGVGNTRISTDCAQKSPRNTKWETKWRVLRGP
jgi:hypothetical protein